ncbi:hypothetical protein PL10110_250028 [Planktothrix agardhii]|nr:hypothetical protein PL10110_250028 [Planktothrix agardhii]
MSQIKSFENSGRVICSEDIIKHYKFEGDSQWLIVALKLTGN